MPQPLDVEDGVTSPAALSGLKRKLAMITETAGDDDNTSVQDDDVVLVSKKDKKKKHKAKSGSDYVDIYGDGAKAHISLKTDTLRLQDAQHIVTWILGENVCPRWVFIKNKPLVRQVVVVGIPALSFVLQQSQRSALPFLSSTFPRPAQCRMDDGKSTVTSAIDRLLVVRHTKGTKREERRVKRASLAAGEPPPQPPEFYILTHEAMRQLGYPMPVTDADGCMAPPDGYTWTGQSSFQRTENRSDESSDEPSASDGDEMPAASQSPARERHNGDAAANSSAMAQRHSNGKGSGQNGSSVLEMPHLACGLTLCSLDCEMCITGEGFEVTRVSVVDAAGSVLLDTLVLPPNPITDYNTRYSGITAAMMEGVTTTLADVQRSLLKLLPPDAVLVGHSLENDLKALRFLHGRCIDTCMMYPHPRGLPHRCALRNLAEKFLHRTIQCDSHDSVQDARATMELALIKVKNGPVFGTSDKGRGGLKLTEVLAQSGMRSCLIDRLPIVKRHVGGDCSGISVESDTAAADQVVKEVSSETPDGSPRNRFVFTRFNGLMHSFGDAVRDLQATYRSQPSSTQSAASASSPPAKGEEHTQQPSDLLDASGCRKALRKRKAEAALARKSHDVPTLKIDEEQLTAHLGSLDAHVKRIWEAAKPNSLFLVVSLGGNTAYTRWIHELRHKRQARMAGFPPWSQACEEHYMRAMDEAICGCLWTAVKV